ncbi:MAG: response regulator [Bacillota bacterium]
MMSLLIVDDEVIIADGLAEMLQDTLVDQLVVYRRYSVADAKALLENERVDIMLTDINMPETSGLELHRWAVQRWPFIKVIYLTGYSDFQYARQAVKQQAFDYVLKSDGDERIVSTVRRAMSALTEDARQFLRNPLFVQARPLYTRQLMDQLLYDPHLRIHLLAKNLTAWKIPLSVERPVLLALCIFRRTGAPLNTIMDAIEALSGEKLHLILTDMNKREIAVLAQENGNEGANEEFNRCLQTAQRLAEEQGERMTVAIIDRSIAWEELAQANMRILKQLNALCPSPGEMLAVSLSNADASSAAAAAPRLGHADILKHLHELNEYLLTGQRDLYLESEESLWALVQGEPNTQHAEVVFDIMKMILHTCAESFSEQDQLRMITLRQSEKCLQDYPDTLAAFADLRELSGVLFDMHGKRTDRRQQGVVNKVNGYIQTHMGEDLSLTRLAEVTHFHPVYLSRIYKESSGVSLSEYIAEQRLEAASQMLRDTKVKIQKIAEITGFSSPGYFARFFRKRKGISPQEYRDKL